MASSKHHPIVCPTLAVIVVLGYCTTVWAVEFAGGTGEPNDPYQIATAEQLVAISSDSALYDRHFVLTADIDLDPNLPGGKVFDGPVMQWHPTSRASGHSSVFYGSFSGNGHVIRNLVLRTTYYPGFFGQINETSIVRDLHLENVVIENLAGTSVEGPFCGALTPFNRGTIVNCSATGTLTGVRAAGLIGRNWGVMAGCRARCDITGVEIGGLIGINEATGRVILCESNGALDGEVTGGLVSENAGTIQYCSAGGLVSAGVAGGLVSHNSGSIRESYATATVSGATVSASSHGGGLVSYNTGTIVNCYATGPVSGPQVDGLVATNSGTILSSYSTTASQPRPMRPRGVRSFVVTASAAAEMVVRYVYYLDANRLPGHAESPYNGYGVALPEAEMKQAASFVGFDFYSDANDGPAGHWFMPADGYPVLTWQTEITGLTGVPDVLGLSPEQAGLVLETAGLEPNGTSYDYARPITFGSGRGPWKVGTKGKAIAALPVGYLSPGSPVETVIGLGEYDFSKNPGDGSEANPYQIATAGQLDSLCDQTIPLGRRYILTADIDLSAYRYTGPLIRSLLEEFNGKGHTVRGLQIAMASSYGNECGLFARVEPTGSVHDLTVEQATLYTAGHSIGILVGENKGHVLRCMASGCILGGSGGVGGLVGHNNTGGQLTDCRFSGRVWSANESRDTGGLVGNNMGAVVGCCVDDVDVSGGDRVGGLVGQNALATGVVEACYATGAVQGNDSVGGLVGSNGRRVLVRSILAESQVAIAADPVADGMVRECYAACSVTGQRYAGGLIGLAVVEAVQESCFFLDPKDGGGPDNGLGAPLTASQMKQQASFIDWDFIDTWTICEGTDYPRLKWENTECP